MAKLESADTGNSADCRGLYLHAIGNGEDVFVSDTDAERHGAESVFADRPGRCPRGVRWRADSGRVVHATGRVYSLRRDGRRIFPVPFPAGILADRERWLVGGPVLFHLAIYLCGRRRGMEYRFVEREDVTDIGTIVVSISRSL